MKRAKISHYARTFQSTSLVKSQDICKHNVEIRNSGTAIYYLLQAQDFSAWHRLKSDEIWHFYKGYPIRIHVLNIKGELKEYVLGDGLKHPEALFQLAIPAGNWFAAELVDKSTYCFVGCTVTPGFDFKDFELADRFKLSNEFPTHRGIIERLTRIPHLL